jgi:6-phosphogluconolactonase
VADRGSEVGLNGTRVEILDDPDAVARDAGRRTIAALAAGIATRRAAHVALTGGSSAASFYRELAATENRDALDWRRVHLWWGDERFVPIDHPESNAGMAYRLLLAMPQAAGQTGEGGQYDDVAAGDVRGIPIDPAHVHPVEVVETMGDDAPTELAAERYQREIERFVPLGPGGVPIFDVILTGIGPDGHIMSLFPGSLGLAPSAPIALGIPAPEHVEPHLDRVTLSARVLAPAGLVLVMASGTGKAGVVADVLRGERDRLRWPAQSALLPNAVWLLDRAAAAGVNGATGTEVAR